MIAILTDIHFGLRTDSVFFDECIKKFMTCVFFPELDKRNIKTLFILGDTFDRRKYINFITLYSCKQYFFNELQKRNIETVMLVGNHDAAWKQSIVVNSPSLLLKEYKNITVVDSPLEYVNGDIKFAMIPWICDDNLDEINAFIKNTNAGVLFSHLELHGFEFQQGQVNHDGMKADIFDKFDMVLTGHYHHKSEKNNIIYLGTSCEHNWGDYGDKKGFHFFDPNTRELEFVENPFVMHHKIFYDDSDGNFDINQDLSIYSGTYVKVFVKNKTNPYHFDLFLSALERVNPIDTQIIEDALIIEVGSDAQEIINEAEDTKVIMNCYLNELDTNVDKIKLDNLLNSLYNEAMSLQ